MLSKLEHVVFKNCSEIRPTRTLHSNPSSRATSTPRPLTLGIRQRRKNTGENVISSEQRMCFSPPSEISAPCEKPFELVRALCLVLLSLSMY